MTQTRRDSRQSRQRVRRTVLQTAVSVLAAVAAFVVSGAIFAPQLLEALKQVLPPEWYAVGLGIVAFISALAGAITRIMAIPGVDEWLTKIGVGTYPPQHQRSGDLS